MKTRKPCKPTSHQGESMLSESRGSLRDDLQSTQLSSHPDAFNTIYGLIPVLESLRGGHKQLEHITIAEGARHERLRELLELAKLAKVPVHRAPRFALDRALPGVTHQGVIAKTAAARYKEASELLEELGAQVDTSNKPLVL